MFTCNVILSYLTKPTILQKILDNGRNFRTQTFFHKEKKNCIAMRDLMLLSLTLYLRSGKNHFQLFANICPYASFWEIENKHSLVFFECSCLSIHTTLHPKSIFLLKRIVQWWRCWMNGQNVWHLYSLLSFMELFDCPEVNVQFRKRPCSLSCT